MVHLDLPGLVAASAELYGASGVSIARDAAGLMRQAALQKAAAPPQPLPVLAHLDAIALPSLAPANAAMVAGNARHLPWTDGGFVLPPGIRRRNAYAELVGPDAPLHSAACRFGFYLQAPGCLYPVHSHAAEELYLTLNGGTQWWLDGVGSFTPGAPGLVHHRPWQKHAMRTGAEPLLAMWVWLGDIRYETYSI